MNAIFIVIISELFHLSPQVDCVPDQHVVKKLPSYRPDQPLWSKIETRGYRFRPTKLRWGSEPQRCYSAARTSAFCKLHSQKQAQLEVGTFEPQPSVYQNLPPSLIAGTTAEHDPLFRRDCIDAAIRQVPVYAVYVAPASRSLCALASAFSFSLCAYLLASRYAAS